MKIQALFVSLVVTLALSFAVRADSPVPGKNMPEIRGHRLEVYYYPGAGAGPHPKIMFSPGDGGWRGFALTVAQRMSAWGYDVFGLDTKDYLESFTDGKETLKESDVMGDYGSLARWITQGANEKVILVGWSEGAGLSLLGASSPDSRKFFSGLVVFGLDETSVLGWRWADNITYITGKDPNEPVFKSVDYLAQVAPLPFFMIQSTGDQYISVEEARQMFALAREPKRFELIEAQNHRFDGSRDQFFAKLREGIQWTIKTSR